MRNRSSLFTIGIGVLLGMTGTFLLLLPTLSDSGSPTTKPGLQAGIGYLFEPEPDCEPYLPGQPQPARTKNLLDCVSPFRNNPGFVTTADVHPGDIICVHYTTEPGGPRSVTYKVTEGPFHPFDGDPEFSNSFIVEPSPYDSWNQLSTSWVGMELSRSTHFQMFSGWSNDNFTTAGPCTGPGKG